MRSQLHNGKITPPPSLAAALERRRQLDYETKRIEEQIDDVTRVVRYPDMKAYDEWTASARHALKLFRGEKQQLETWITNNQPAMLLKEAYLLIKTLEEDLNGDLDPHEQRVIERLDDYFKQQTLKATG